MKSILKLALILALLVARPLHAEVTYFSFGITNTLVHSNSTLVNLGTNVVVDNHNSVGLLFTAGCSAAGATNVGRNQTFTIARVPTGTNAETVPAFTWSIPSTSTNVVAFTNLDMTILGASYALRVVGSTNACDSSDFTNAVFTVVRKRIR